MAFPSHYFGCTQERKKEKKEEELESKRQTAIKKVFFPFPPAQSGGVLFSQIGRAHV